MSLCHKSISEFAWLCVESCVRVSVRFLPFRFRIRHLFFFSSMHFFVLLSPCANLLVHVDSCLSRIFLLPTISLCIAVAAATTACQTSISRERADKPFADPLITLIWMEREWGLLDRCMHACTYFTYLRENKQSASLKKRNDFKLSHESLLHFHVLFLRFVVATLLLCCSTEGRKIKKNNKTKSWETWLKEKETQPHHYLLLWGGFCCADFLVRFN